VKQTDLSGLAGANRPTGPTAPSALQIVAEQREQGEQLYQYQGAAVPRISDGAAGRSRC
jgi:hypothetical protein